MKKFNVILVLSLLYAALLWFDFPRISNLIQNSANAEVTEPSRRDGIITIAVTDLMKKEHISEWTLNEKLSERTITSFLKVLDPQKLYFYQSDVDYFRARQPQLGDMFKNGDIKLAYVIFKTYLNRLDERISQMQTALEQPIDFTIDESMTIEPKKLTNPKTRKEAEERVRLRVKYDMLILQVDDLRKEQKASKESDSDSEVKEDQSASNSSEDAAKKEAPKTPEEKYQANKEKLLKRYTSFQKRMHQLDNDELLEFYLTAMTNSYDPHSSYMSPSTLENFEISMSLGLQGIGATLSSEDGYVTVKHLVPGGPADKEGTLKINDKICGVAQGDDGPMEDVVDMKLDDVVKKIRGNAGTVVRLEVIPENGSGNKIVRIVRSKIELKDSEAKGVVFEAGQKADGTPYKIGVINLPSFYLDMQAARFGEGKSSTRDVRAILEDFNAKGVDSVVLDLRNNGGGSLPEAISLTGLFIDHGSVVQVRDSKNHILSHDDRVRGVSWNGPLVVVINKLSASASEILAGAIQDYNRGLIIGDKTTHGKGSVQTVEYLSQRLFALSSSKYGALKVTIQQFYRPLGASTQERGVTSDIELPSITTHMNIGESDLDYPLAFDQIPAQPITKWSKGPTPEMIQALAQLSSARVSDNAEYQKLLKKIDFYCKIKDRETVTLNLEKFMAERADVLQDEEEKLDEKLSSDANEIKRDYSMDEILNIMVDYTRALEKE
ncbi:MAG: carboxy terminal-processing peptidase [Thermoguttaceae bacterium]|nr:carboxy terminal-processing peptidase [Thermoguttaceae bacterium]